jgi:predicted lipoprotein with Yx(FWY)xxD motif
MIKSAITITTMVVVFLVAGCATPTIATGDLGKTHETAVGRVLVDSKGMTLYTYDKDAPGKSNCTGMCAVFWPPAEAAPGATASGNFTLVDRGKGSRQWAYKRMLLYGYIRDENPGDVAGDGADGVWHVVRP